MQFFSARWASGQLGDEASDEVLQRYRDHLATLDQSGSVVTFATTVRLNDAYLDRLTIDRDAGRIELLLLTGDLQVGYWRTTLSYSSARIADGETVLKQGLSLRPTEVWYDEFFNSREGMSHAFLLAPRRSSSLQSRGEFRIAFGDFSFSQTPAQQRYLATAEDQSRWG